jgi:hypothetical protein
MSLHRVTHQRYAADCGVATLTMLLSEKGITYEDVLAAVTEEVPQLIKRGMYVPEIIRAAARFGVTLKQKRRYDLEEATGILRVTWKDRGGAHVVYVRGGQLFDTDGVVWDPDLYLDSRGAVPRVLLVEA